MTATAGIELKRTALNAIHRAAGAKMVEFGGWEMPVEYSGIVQEHVAVRTRAGLFDVSHMGEIEIRGSRALDLVQYVTSNDAAKLQINQAQYTALMYPQGSAVDDCLLHKFAADHYFLCVNAANTAKDFAWITRHNSFGADVRDVSTNYSQLALQGPRAVTILTRVSQPDVAGIKYYWFTRAMCCGVEGLLARTGYTGEDGFEFYFPPSESECVWSGLLEAGRDDGLIPAGLGARNTLRLEAAFPLYGHELDSETTLLEAGLGWIAKLDKGDFLGRDALAAQKQFGTRKKLVGFEMADRGVARDSYPVSIGGERVGKVTSGSYAPFLKKNIGLAYLPPEKVNEAGARGIQIEIRGRAVPARLAPLPFYKRNKL
ncbi:MAG TPA: glycine cleavage system aminomethyltransferase GcvT [Terriglobia bacterium]|nr:glycine cleavage system aminomethyltransferase GcvT [Terriglobia bacterium]